ncbi:galactosyldiacylglycerol synthase [Streptomyces pluripotens]|uniref:Galactosyldiacylglycerol synthase n=1 Tax=Streptomyces pluripotens TaxID=1355015 RepID=A0A221NSR6_9ACTN|nr:MULTISPECIES: galactosyldiacylglycerol synthase [Streptomyces]ARP68761.1 galactosyldiacylglycerol synthase [Streptomyces pluripotens]ASN23017.1 galactosyldiacylglycerol synthase [Streptomyces pluripotens]MCH0558505.1 galactosyldiacylglycerol synthase [Streptomyces sp. MUM 16J]
MGAGHDTVAAELARRATVHGHEPHVFDVLRLLPHGLGTGLRRFYQASVRHFPWMYAGIYRAFLRGGAWPRPSGVPLARLAGGRLLELVDRLEADVVLSVFHLAAQLTGDLRSRGALPVPSDVFLLDFAVHRQWLHPGNDRYLCLTDEAASEVCRALGRPVVTTGPVVAPEFLRPPPGATHWQERFAARAPGRLPVLLSAGAWGAASHPAATARLLVGAGYLPVVLCGRNERLLAQVSRVASAIALDWVDDMPGLLAASYALLDNAAGQTAVQALAAGLPVVGFRPLPGHGTDGVRRMDALGLSEFAADGPALLAALDRLSRASWERANRVARGHALFRDDPMECVLRR